MFCVPRSRAARRPQRQNRDKSGQLNRLRIYEYQLIACFGLDYRTIVYANQLITRFRLNYSPIQGKKTLLKKATVTACRPTESNPDPVCVPKLQRKEQSISDINYAAFYGSRKRCALQLQYG